jgi:hypothetical protein
MADSPHNFAVEQTAGPPSLARGCSPRRSAHMTPVDTLFIERRRRASA